MCRTKVTTTRFSTAKHRRIRSLLTYFKVRQRLNYCAVLEKEKKIISTWNLEFVELCLIVEIYEAKQKDNEC